MNAIKGRKEKIQRILLHLLVLLTALAFLSTVSLAQKKNSRRSIPAGNAVMWEPVDISRQDLFLGPGGSEMRPDLSKITFIKKENHGHNKKYRIKDGSGRIWVAKPYTEARPETASVRLLYGLGYKTEINYLVPSLTIPTVGTFKNVRLELRPENVDRLDNWKWKNNPFVGTNELQGLKIMQLFLNNNDVIDINNKVLKVEGKHGIEYQYVISDLGSTLGKRGNNNLPLFYRLGRKNDSPPKWSRSSFVKGARKGKLVLHTKGIKNRGLYKNITVDQGRWLYDLLRQLNTRQIEDAFRAANYSPAEVEVLTAATRRRIEELERATNVRFAEKY